MMLACCFACPFSPVISSVLVGDEIGVDSFWNCNVKYLCGVLFCIFINLALE
jgi:hypothetical protein